MVKSKRDDDRHSPVFSYSRTVTVAVTVAVTVTLARALSTLTARVTCRRYDAGYGRHVAI